MSKADYSVRLVSKTACVPLLQRYHYLSNISKGFKSGFNVGLHHRDNLVGVCIFTGWPVPELLKGCFGLPRTEQDGFWELSRLVLHPEHQSSEHNLASWFVSRSVRKLKASQYVRSILSYADDGFHQGTVYAASNFKYYGLSDAKNDFWIKQPDGTFKKHSRGKVKGLDGEWRPRTRKHRFLLTYDKSLSCQWVEQKWKPTIKEVAVNFEDYQTQASKTAVYPDADVITYPTFGLVSEAGEVAGKVKKVLRDKNGHFDPVEREKIADEVGDVLWYIAALCTDLGIGMETIAQRNLDKLNSRMARGVIQGSGDNR